MNVDFDTFYEAHYRKVYNYVYYRLLNRADAEDVVSEVFTKALRSIHSFDAKQANVSTWMFKIAANAVADHFRRAKKVVQVSLEDVELSSPDSAWDTLIRGEETRMLHGYLKTLDDRTRSVIALRYWGELSYAQIAEQTGLSEKNVSVILSRGLGKLRNIFGKTL